MNDNFMMHNHKCSECGKDFSFFSYTSYTYKVNYAGKITYQCGYTCHDHALLRVEDPEDYYPESKYKDAVIRCENSMKGQGKTILHPIDIK